MARRIVWTSRADALFMQILEFYVHKNKSKSYSRKLNREVNELIHLISLYPFLGTQTDDERIKAFIKGYFKIFYEVKTEEIVVHLVWDTRQNPNNLPLR